MRGTQAKRLRKYIYGTSKHLLRQRTYQLVKVRHRRFGWVPGFIINSFDSPRARYQALKTSFKRMTQTNII